MKHCDKSIKDKGVVNNYCCCKTALCNDKAFAEKCGNNIFYKY